MGLRDIVTARVEVPVMGTTLSLRGLSFADLSRLVIDHREDFLAVVSTVQTSDEPDMGALAAKLAQTAPGLIAKVIALACDEPDLLDAAAALPGPVQLECIMAVGQLTFSEPGAFPKFMANLTGLMQAGAGLVRQTR
jgi:hypothetical protein